MGLEDIENDENNKMSFKSWVIELFEDERKHTSIKPIIALLGSLSLCIIMIIDATMKGGFTPSTSLIDAVMIITSIGMGADSLDKFSFRGHSGDGYSSSESYTHSESSDNSSGNTVKTTKTNSSSTNISDDKIGKSSEEVL